MKLLIYKLKYDSDRLIANDLALLLAGAYSVISQSMPADISPCLIPIPLSCWRETKRGFNQSELLSRHVSKRTDARALVVTDVLRRRKHTKAQHNLNKQERVINLQNAFSCASNKVLPKSIIIVDDIHTSGSTLAEAARTLYIAGATHIAAITVARALLNYTWRGHKLRF